MSIEKDVEKLYREDQEMQKKNNNKKKNNRIIVILLIILIIAALLWLLNYLGLGLGGGKGSGGDSKGNQETPAVTTEATTTEAPKEYENIKVSGGTYIYKGSEIELDSFVDTVNKMNENVVVLIQDDNATQNAMEDLKAALKKNDRAFAEESSQTTEDSGSDESSKAE